MKELKKITNRLKEIAGLGMGGNVSKEVAYQMNKLTDAALKAIKEIGKSLTISSAGKDQQLAKIKDILVKALNADAKTIGKVLPQALKDMENIATGLGVQGVKSNLTAQAPKPTENVSATSSLAKTNPSINSNMV